MGFLISSNGLLVTNFHVIEDAHFASILLASNTTFFVEGVAATDQDNDLALLKVNGTELPFLLLDEGDPPKVGIRVYAIGNPKGLTNTFSEGLVSAICADEDQVRRIIQTTAAISPGSSGGPLIGPDGKVVGVTTAYMDGGQNLNFAVPTSHINVLVANKGELVSLASAGAKPLDSHATDELDKVWTAINENAFSKALSLMATLRSELQDSSYYWYTMGYLHAEMDNYDLAISANKSAITIKPDFAMAYNNMGLALIKLDRHEEALAAVRQAAGSR